MRLFGVLALCFILLAVLIFGYDRRYEIADRFSDSIEGLLLDERFTVDAPPSGLAPENLETANAVIAMREAGTLNAVVGLPDFARVHFDMPRTVTPRSGEIVLEMAGALDREADAVLRVTVNGVRRSAVLLDGGSLHRKLVMPLNTRELAAETLAVSIAVEGRAPEIECTADWNGGIVLQVLPTSHLRLQVTEPITDPSDKLLLAGAPAQLEWPEGSADDQTLTLSLAHQLTQQYGNVLFAAPAENNFALPVADIRALAAVVRPQTKPEVRDPADLAEDLGQRRAQSFETEARWRMSFDIDSLPGRPLALDLGFIFASAVEDETPWLLSVFLNDRLLHAQRTNGRAETFQRRLPVPQSMLLQGNRRNIVTVTFQDSTHRVGPCPTGAPAVAELTAARLITADSPVESNVADLTALLADGARLKIPETLTFVEGQVALDALNKLQEYGLNLQADAQQQVTAVANDALDAYLKAQEETVWLAYQSSEDDGRLIVEKPLPGAAVQAESLPRSVLVISPARQQVSQ